ncbi:hypothetical protein KZX47_05690 [Thermus sp. SYSU G05001]|uniref:Uncharacterized protein n=1 Tax=Thermus brevis TaxID=2862456 RepID=A0ABS6ZX67_9DEIN|nr:hypothetical protein [Thermus brevis]MBW6394645.1 hypothetical protein [Thermus brevis]
MDVLAELATLLPRLAPGMGLVLLAYRIGDWWQEENGTSASFLPLVAALAYFLFVR